MKIRPAVAWLLSVLVLGSSVGISSAAPETDLELYFGDLHTHTRYSDGWEGTPEDAYIHAREAGADYMATSDHNFMLTEDEWERTKRQATRQTSGSFAAAETFG